MARPLRKIKILKEKMSHLVRFLNFIIDYINEEKKPKSSVI